MIQATIAWLEAPYQLEFKTERLADTLLADELLCETLASAISPGTELAAYTGQAPLRPGKLYPRLMGYCNVARVLSCGSGVNTVQAGDRVLTFSSHRSHFICTQAQILCRLPDQLGSEQACCGYLYHLGYDALLKSGVRYGSSVLIIGLGVLGLGATAMAVNAGARVYAVSDHPTPAAIARQMGAQQVFTRADQTPLLSTLAPRLADTVITTSNSWDDWQLALMAAGHNSQIAVLGFPGRGLQGCPLNPLDSQYFYAKQLRIQAVGMAPETLDSRQFLKFNEQDNLAFILCEIAANRLKPEQLISQVFPWHQLDAAYQGLIAKQHSPITYVLNWSADD